MEKESAPNISTLLWIFLLQQSDFLGSPVVKTHTSIAGDVSSVPGQGTKILSGGQKKPKKILIHTNRSFSGITSKIINNVYF